MRFLAGNSPQAIAICEALGINTKTVTSVQFRIAVNEAITVKIERLVYDDEAKALTKVLDVCRLVAKEDEPLGVELVEP